MKPTAVCLNTICDITNLCSGHTLYADSTYFQYAPHIPIYVLHNEVGKSGDEEGNSIIESSEPLNCFLYCLKYISLKISCNIVCLNLSLVFNQNHS